MNYELRILKILLLFVGLFSAVFTSCEKDDMPDEDDVVDNYMLKIEGITADNYPKVDASTAASPLQMLIACKLLGWQYDWIRTDDFTFTIVPRFADVPTGFNLRERIKTSQTHYAILNLINKEADIILSARKMSSDEKKHADEMGVTLIETPIALDGFIFIVNQANSIKSLTTKQIQDIYTGEITEWGEVGGNAGVIMPYIRNANSGSQELMETLVMKDLPMVAWPQEPQFIFPTITSMSEVLITVMQEVNSICFTLYYYHSQMMKENIAKTIAINGIVPDEKSIGERRYPYIAELYVVIRSDLDKSSMAYKLYELLQTEEAKQVITESGYVPIMNEE